MKGLQPLADGLQSGTSAVVLEVVCLVVLFLLMLYDPACRRGLMRLQ